MTGRKLSQMRVMIFRADVMDQNLREGQLFWALILDISFIYSFINLFLVLIETSFSDPGFRFQILDSGFLPFRLKFDNCV